MPARILLLTEENLYLRLSQWELDLTKAEIQKILSDRTLTPIQQLVKIREVIG